MSGKRTERPDTIHLAEAISLALKSGAVRTDRDHLERWRRLCDLLSKPGFAGTRKKERRAKRILTADYEFITAIVEPGSRVLDLGCGGGELLAMLRERKNVSGRGIEINQDEIVRCIEQGIPVIQADIDHGLAEHGDQTYDYVVLNRTLQVIHNPELVLKEMVRVGRKGIVSVPNFAHWEVRLQLLLRGRMPMTSMLPHSWYASPNIHLCSLEDFADLCGKLGIRIIKQVAFVDGEPCDMTPESNLLAEEGLYVISRDSR
ncbi:MAG: methionine biosynthesis protein MetW [Planctomycetota bacterium]|nr:methionine biosynthesis protein MetW [Planctomycetota bacterium]